MNNNRYSDAKIVWFPDKLSSFRDGTITAPIYVRVKPTNRCNHACDWCAYGHGSIESGMHEQMDAREVMPRDKLLETLGCFRDMGVKAVTYSGGGEPLSYAHITEAMAMTVNYGIDLSIITNGSLLENQRAEILTHGKWVRVSMDYVNGHQMAASRGVDQFDRVIKNMREFAAKKGKCELGVNYIVTRENYDGLEQLCRRLKDIGVQNVRVSPVWLPNFAKYHAPISGSVMKEIEAAKKLGDRSFTVYSSYDLDNPAHGVKRDFGKCLFTQMVPVVAADQNVYHCHNTAYAKHGLIGSIRNRTFQNLWFSDDAKKAFAKLNPQHSCKHQCAAHGKNELIHSLLAASGDNFV